MIFFNICISLILTSTQIFTVFSNPFLSEVDHQTISSNSDNTAQVLTNHQIDTPNKGFCGEAHSETKNCTHTNCCHSSFAQLVQPVQLNVRIKFNAKFNFKNDIFVLNNYHNTIYRPPIV